MYGHQWQHVCLPTVCMPCMRFFQEDSRPSDFLHLSLCLPKSWECGICHERCTKTQCSGPHSWEACQFIVAARHVSHARYASPTLRPGDGVVMVRVQNTAGRCPIKQFVSRACYVHNDCLGIEHTRHAESCISASRLADWLLGTSTYYIRLQFALRSVYTRRTYVPKQWLKSRNGLHCRPLHGRVTRGLQKKRRIPHESTCFETT
jgi:hypothetical protein